MGGPDSVYISLCGWGKVGISTESHAWLILAGNLHAKNCACASRLTLAPPFPTPPRCYRRVREGGSVKAIVFEGIPSLSIIKTSS